LHKVLAEKLYKLSNITNSAQWPAAEPLKRKAPTFVGVRRSVGEDFARVDVHTVATLVAGFCLLVGQAKFTHKGTDVADGCAAVESRDLEPSILYIDDIRGIGAELAVTIVVDDNGSLSVGHFVERSNHFYVPLFFLGVYIITHFWLFVKGFFKFLEEF
jgi:hypothetical protein